MTRTELTGYGSTNIFFPLTPEPGLGCEELQRTSLGKVWCRLLLRWQDVGAEPCHRKAITQAAAIFVMTRLEGTHCRQE